MQRALDSGAVVIAELTDVVRHVVEIRRGDRTVREQHLAPRHAGLGFPPEVEHDLQQLPRIGPLVKRAGEV